MAIKPLDLHKDAWRRFERATDVVAKSPPQPKTKKATRKKTKKRG
jgi:hypothetical protein